VYDAGVLDRAGRRTCGGSRKKPPRKEQVNVWSTGSCETYKLLQATALLFSPAFLFGQLKGGTGMA
jgi:hypothetical protein